MTFVNFSLLLGGAAIGIPIVLHLIMRQKPKVVEFPAVMFLIERKESNRRRLQLRHWLLLALRCLALLLLALGLARPSVASALVGNWVILLVLAALAALVGTAAAMAWLQGRNRLVAIACTAVAGVLLAGSLVTLLLTLSHDEAGNIGGEEVPVAAVMLIDTSPRMQYRHQNQTRLEHAKETALWLLTQLPEGSDVAVADTHLGASVFAVDRGAARKTIEGLQVDAASRPIAEVLPQALGIAAGSEKMRREIYIFTDLSQTAWPNGTADRVQNSLADVENAAVYLIDVGVRKPVNFTLGEVQLSHQVLPRNGTLEISTQLLHEGPGGERVVELEIEKYQPKLPIIVDGEPKLPEVDPAKRRRQTVDIAADGSAVVQFSVAGLDIGTHHGRIKLDRPDALDIDDVRYFTFEVREPWSILVAYGEDAEARFLTEAIAPTPFRLRGEARFQPSETPIAQLSSRKLDDYPIVCLLDPPPLAASQWQQLAAYAQQGGQLAIFLGNNANKSNFNSPPAQDVLPGKLDRQWRSGVRPREFDGRADLYLAPQAMEHPMLAAFRDIAANVPWYASPVFRHWSFEDGKLADGTSTIVAYNNNQPAVVERSVGSGRVLLMTTPITDTQKPPGREPWNWLPTVTDNWPYMMFINETMLYLAGSGDVQLNYQSGQTAGLDASNVDNETYLLFTPGGGRPSTVRSVDGQLRLPFTATPGAYRLKPTVESQPRGFSVNLPVAASDLARIEAEQLDAILGEGQYKVATKQEEIVREQGHGRVGREFFPFLMLVVAVLFGMEAVLSNRFYRTE